jgi:hypothetical protein
MKRAALVLLSLLPAGCGMIKGNRTPPADPNALQLTFQKSGDPFGTVVPTLSLPSMPQATAAAGAQAGADGVPVNPLLDFSSAFSRSGPARSSTLDWHHSGTDAALESRRSGRPMLLFLVDSHIPAAISLQTTLATKPETGTLIESHFVPLMVDYGDKDTRDSLYYRAMRDRYKPRGFPVLIAVLPDGTEVSRQSGYTVETKDRPDWDRRTLEWIRSAGTQSEKAITARRKRMESSGYREWKSKSGAPVFAKLVKVDANQAVFVSEWGETFRTFTSRLAEEEQPRLQPPTAAVHQGKPQ